MQMEKLDARARRALGVLAEDYGIVDPDLSRDILERLWTIGSVYAPDSDTSPGDDK